MESRAELTGRTSPMTVSSLFDYKINTSLPVCTQSSSNQTLLVKTLHLSVQMLYKVAGMEEGNAKWDVKLEHNSLAAVMYCRAI